VRLRAGTIASLTVIAILLAAPAYAYVDPGTGSMLVQLLTGGTAGALVLARLYWRRLRERVTGKSQATPAPTPADAPSDHRR
jgi:Na+/proline symporter